MKKVIIAMFGVMIWAGGPATSQALSELEVAQVADKVQQCLQYSVSNDEARGCLEIPVSFLDCDDSAWQQDSRYGGGQSGAGICMGDASKVVDAVLNNEYRKTVDFLRGIDLSEYSNPLNVWDVDQQKSVTQSREETLRISQRAWLTYRDTHCIAENIATSSGSIHSLNMSGCFSGLMKDQIMFLMGLRLGAGAMGEGTFWGDEFRYDGYK